MANEYLSRASSTTSTTKFTVSAWVKRFSTGSRQAIFSTDAVTNSNQVDNLGGSGLLVAFWGDDTISVTGYGGSVQLFTNAKYRDSGQFYHVVLAVDTTQSTSTNRIRLWVNGQEITSFSTYNAINQNKDFKFAKHRIGVGMDKNAYTDDDYAAMTYYMNGCMSDVFVVEGQALSGSVFGKTSLNSQWVPKHPTAIKASIVSSGGFGTNGYYLPFGNNQSSTTSAMNSIAFDGLSDTLTTPSNADFDLSGKIFTIEGWFYRNNLTEAQNVAFTCGTGGSALYWGGGVGNSNGQIWIGYGPGAWTWSAQYYSANGEIEAGKWYHIAFTGDGTTLRMYKNGSLIKSFSSFGIGAQGGTFYLGTYFNNYNNDGSWYNGKISNFRILKGTCLYSSSTYTVPTSTLSNITNTSILLGYSNTTNADGSGRHTMTVNADAAAQAATTFTYYNSVYADQSGNNSTIASNGELYNNQDSITNTFVTLNPLNKANTSLYDGGTRAVTGGNNSAVWLNHGFTSGKWYWEIKKNYGDMAMVIYPDYISTATLQTTATPTFNSNWYYTSEGTGTNRYTLNGTGIAMPTGWGDDVDGDIYSLWLDMDANPPVLYARHNGNASTQATMTLSSEFKNQPMKVGYSVSTTWPVAEFIYNTGQGTFVTSNSGSGYSDSNGKGKFQYQPPSGYLALCEDNFVDPTTTAAVNPRLHVKAITYTGDGTAARAITGVGFRPGLVILKNRDNTYYGQMHDSVRGATAGAIYTGTNTLTQDASYPLVSFDADGFTTKNATGTSSQNGSTERISAWCWKAGDTVTTNTSGTITSNVSVNSAAGFSIVKYNASSSPATIGHGLSAAPHFIIVRGGYDSQSYNFDVYHKDLGATKRLLLNSTSVAETTSGPWNNTAPTSTVINQGNAWYANGVNNIAYCWTEIPGYSKFGSYNYNNSTDGPFIHLGFKPAIILIKNTDNTEQWYIVDNARNTINGDQTAFLQMSTNTESTSNTQATDSRIDFLSNGFKLRDLGSAGAGEVTFGTRNYIYAAWAESPFDFSNAR